MDIESDADVLLRDAGYTTQRWLAKTFSALIFEDDSVIGFLHVFQSARSLLSDWQGHEQSLLAAYAPALRVAGGKAWNVYTVLLTDDTPSPEVERAILRLDENLQLTRKVARAGVTMIASLRSALYPLLPIGSRPSPERSNYVERLRRRLELDIDPTLVDAFVGSGDGEELVHLMVSTI